METTMEDARQDSSVLSTVCPEYAPEYYETIINEFKQLLMQLKQLGDYCGYGLIHADGNMHYMGICKPGLYCDNEKQRCKREGNYISYTDWWWWSCIIVIIQTGGGGHVFLSLYTFLY